MPVEPLHDEKTLSMLFERIDEEYGDDEIIRLDGLDDAILGLGVTFAVTTPRLVYSQAKILEVLVDRGMTEEEAIEYFDFNIGCLYAGPGTPTIVQML